MFQEDELYEPDDEDCEDFGDSLKLRNFVMVCPNCKQQISQEHDSCPFCGDIIFRHLTDGTFAPKKGPLTKIFAALIITLVVFAVLGLLIQLIF